MAAAGDVLVRCHRLLEGMVRPGVTTKQLDEAAEKFIRSQGGVPSFKGYRGFPGSICASPNHMVVHGIPGPYALQKGDVHLDRHRRHARRLGRRRRADLRGRRRSRRSPRSCCEVTEESLFKAVEQCRVGNRLGAVSNAVQTHVESNGLSVVRSLVGHGIGRDMHEDPQIPNFGPVEQRPEARGGHGPGGRADGHRRSPRRPDGRRPLGDLQPGRLARRPLRVHRSRSPPTARGSSRPWHEQAGAAAA